MNVLHHAQRPTPQQIANLRILADFLDDNAEKLVAFEQFYMGWFRSDQDPCLIDGEIVDVLTLGCDTTACAVGWATTLPELQPIPRDFSPFSREIDWHQYIRRVFGLSDFSDDWAKCFGGSTSDDPRAAAERLRQVADRHDRFAKRSVA